MKWKKTEEKLLQARVEYNKWLSCDVVDDKAVMLAIKLYEQAVKGMETAPDLYSGKAGSIPARG